MKQKWTLGLACALALCWTVPAAMTSEKVDDGKAKERIESELKAMKDRKPQATCPISGKAIAEGQGYEYMGYHIGTCCPDCVKVVEKDPLSAILKIRQNKEEPQLAEGFKAQDRCPMSGKPIKEDIYLIKNNQLVRFCCPGCPEGYAKDPEGITGKLMESKQAPVIITLAQDTCPVSGHAASGGTPMTHNGKVVQLCCEACKAEFDKDPDKYIQSMKDAGYVLENAKE